jgi:hypothetical protein
LKFHLATVTYTIFIASTAVFRVIEHAADKNKKELDNFDALV